MAILNWTESLSVKIESIDNQHKKLIDLLNSFYEKMSSADSRENLIKLINGLREYTLFHFSTEEKYMKKFCYPDFDNHKQEHEKFINTVNDYIERIQSDKLIISLEITNYIKSWISNHIVVTDKKYSDFFIQKGVK